MSMFTKVFEKDYSDVFFEDFPVTLQKSRIMFDSESDKLITQFKLMNTSSETVEKVYLRIVFFDSEKNLIKTVEEHIVLYSAKQGESFGENAPLYDNDKSIASCDVIITKVALADGTVWNNENNLTGEEVSPAKIIVFSNELRTQFYKYAAKSGIKTDCEFEEHEKYWRCSCGMLNSAGKHTCPNCRNKIATLRGCFDTDKLNLMLNQEREAARIEESQKREAAEKASQRRKKIIKIAVPVCAVLIVVGVYIGRMISLGGGSFPDFNDEGIALGVNNGSTVLVNRLGFKVISDIADYAGDWSTGYWLKTSEKWGLIDKKANWVIEPTYDNVLKIEDNESTWISTEGKWGIIDSKGIYIVEPQFDEKPEFDRNGFACVLSNGKYVFIDKTGSYLSELRLDSMPEFDENGCAWVSSNGKYVFIDNTGLYLSELILDSMPEFDENGCAWVSSNGKYVFIDNTGLYLSELRLDTKPDFDEDGLAKFKENDKYGLIDTTGKIVLEPQYDMIGAFRSGFAIVKSGDKYGYIRKSGICIVEPKFDVANSFENFEGNYIAKVGVNNKYGFIDEYGQYIAEPIINSTVKKIEFDSFYPLIRAFRVKVYYGSGLGDYTYVSFDNGKLSDTFAKSAREHGVI